MCGAFWERWVSAHRSRRSVASSAMKMQCDLGNAALGPPLKKAQREGQLIVFVDESGISDRPNRVRTWTPKGQTPIIQFYFNWNHVSVIAGLTRTNCLFRLHKGSGKKEEIVDFLKGAQGPLEATSAGDLGRIEGASQSSGSRQSGRVGRTHPDRIFAALRAGLEPVEYLLAWLKRHALANFCPNNLDELHTTAHNKLKSAQMRPSIIAACWMQATLW
jgi:hypothetical protein